MVKIYYEPADLVALLEARGWAADAAGTPHFVYATAAAGGR